MPETAGGARVLAAEVVAAEVVAAGGELLAGGVNHVVRRGGTVIRPVGPHTPAVHRLLLHLRRAGFRQAPTPLEIDPVGGTETVSYLPGELSPTATGAFGTDRALTSAARLLRRYHDATLRFPVQATDRWDLPVRSPVEVICHGDYSPYNCVVRHGLVVGMFDFDTAHPGSRLWDVGYGAVRWVPLEGPTADGAGEWAGGDRERDEQRRRFRLFCRAYGTDHAGDLGRVVDAAALRLLALVDLITSRADAGHPAFARHRAEGHVEHHLAVVDRLRADRTFLSGSPRYG